MTDATKLQFLRPVLALIGLLAIALWPLSQLWPAGFMWHDVGARSYYFEMICIIYFVLGIFLLVASRNPLEHRSLIWFAVWSSVAHGGLMLVQSFADRPHHLGHLWGDVPLLLFGGALVAWLMPRKVGHIQA
jgi:hypothetical protein